jgi:hypothetical protein
MSPRNQRKKDAIVLDPITIESYAASKSTKAFDLDHQEAELLQKHILENSGGKAVNLCL